MPRWGDCGLTSIFGQNIVQTLNETLGFGRFQSRPDFTSVLFSSLFFVFIWAENEKLGFRTSDWQVNDDSDWLIELLMSQTK